MRLAPAASVFALVLATSCPKGCSPPGGGTKLEIAQVFTESGGSPTKRTSFVAPADKTVAVARVSAADAPRVVWKVRPLNAFTGPAAIETSTGPRLTFSGSSAVGEKGSRDPNAALEYEITAQLDSQTKVVTVRQEVQDVLRQEYVDYRTQFQPQLANVHTPTRPAFNTGNYDVIAEEKPGTLEHLAASIEQSANELLKADKVTVKLDDLITSAFRNPQRNRATGSITINSRHTFGIAFDIDPRTLTVPGRTSADLMCLFEKAAKSAVPTGRVFTEHGAAVFVECDAPNADHVHVELEP